MKNKKIPNFDDTRINCSTTIPQDDSLENLPELVKSCLWTESNFGGDGVVRVEYWKALRARLLENKTALQSKNSKTGINHLR